MNLFLPELIRFGNGGRFDGVVKCAHARPIAQVTQCAGDHIFPGARRFFENGPAFLLQGIDRKLFFEKNETTITGMFA